jgi:hypothetical protein
MGHYYSEMRGLEPHEKLGDFLEEHKDKVFSLITDSGHMIKLKREEIQQILGERSRARQELDEIKSLFRRLSRSGF